MAMNNNQQRINALLSLLEDDDHQVSTVAMEQLLKLEQGADSVVREFQEASSPQLRSRIHQLSNILNLRRSRTLFIDKAFDSSISLWDGLLQINYQYNPRMNSDAIGSMFTELAEKTPTGLSTVRLCAFMRDQQFSPTGEDTLGADLFLLEDVLAQRIGSPILLSVVAHCLGEQAGLTSSIVLHRGKHCLIDANYNLVEPAEGWKISKLTEEDKLHPCGDRDVWLTVLCQLFLAAMLEGRLQAIHRVASILAKLCGSTFHDLPYPLGS